MTMGSRIGILVADDEALVASIVRRALVRVYGNDVVVASNGREAIVALRARPFGLVVTDLKMPGVNGLEVVESARGLRPEAALVVMTGHASAEAEAAIAGAGALLLRKPFDVSSLRDCVARALATR